MSEQLRAVRLRVARNVQHLRRSRGLSQEQFAERVGNTAKHMGQIERGEVNVTIDILTRIAAALSVDVAELFVQPPRRVRAGSSRIFVSGHDLEQIEAIVRRMRSGR